MTTSVHLSFPAAWSVISPDRRPTPSFLMHRASRKTKAPPTRPIVFLDVDGVLLPFGDDCQVHVQPGSVFPDETLAALSHILEQTDALLVLSSTWRASGAAQAEIVAEFARFAASHGGPLGGICGFEHTTSTSTFDVRQREIWDWLQRYQSTSTEEDGQGVSQRGAVPSARRLRHRQSRTPRAVVDLDECVDLDAWVALDDEPLLEGKEAARHRDAFAGHVVQTQSHQGLTMALAERAIALLRGQQLASRGVGESPRVAV